MNVTPKSIDTHYSIVDANIVACGQIQNPNKLELHDVNATPKSIVTHYAIVDADIVACRQIQNRQKGN